MTGKCQLCNQTESLRESHLIPKYIFKWIKDTGSGHLRSAENLNIRRQDGPKYYFLCDNCENLFSGFETYFAKEVFYPIVNDGADRFDYNHKVHLFVLSVLWRLVKQDFLPEESEPAYRRLLTNLEEEWRRYLLGEKKLKDFNRVHLLCGVDVRHPNEIDELNTPDRFIHYFARYVDAGITGNQEHKFLYLKLPRMLFIVPIQGLQEDRFQNTAIHIAGGVYLLEDAGILEPLIGCYFLNRVRQINELFFEVSPNQRQKLADLSEDKWPEIKSKDLGVILDYQHRQQKG